MSTAPIKLYSFPLSGHAHRVRLALSLLKVPTEIIEIDLRRGEQKQPNFLVLNSFGQVPVIDDNGTVVADSNAILVYLARRYGNADWLPTDAVGEAAVQRWLSVAAGLLAFGPAAARLVTVFGASFDSAEVISRAHRLLTVLETELGQRSFLCGAKPSIADIANYSYIAHAPEGNVALDAYPQVRAWLGRIEALPGFIPMQQTAAGLLA
ncbi:glutathione S-transferase [Chitinimonas arctica]|uniref:Glutathione S-transferase n=1 Tax=Chitinimonas arctica TaxID=2594795 RepID=A0A516SDL9_9NEIS|nr:glutathione S-transferase [Chitinimonas arctica]QDQ26255.1 glutathione S-transferase [Chitinimonas arctica]